VEHVFIITIHVSTPRLSYFACRGVKDERDRARSYFQCRIVFYKESTNFHANENIFHGRRVSSKNQVANHRT